MVGGSDWAYVRDVRFSLVARASVSLALLSIEAAPQAHANGRFPESNAIFFAPSDTAYVLLRTTFGLVISHDRGKTWDWVCEQAVGLAGLEDPMYSVTPNGTVIASTFQGLSVSRDGSCNYGYVGGALKDQVFVDLTSRPSTPGNVVAFASSFGGQDDAGTISFKSTLFETKDEGTTFTALGPSLDPTLLGETVDVTASDPDRIYVSAQRKPGMSSTAALLTSRDHGKTWDESPVPLANGERSAFIAAVDPLDADRVYVRTSSSSDMPSRLLVSDDAGKSFKAIFTARGPLAGFALSKDGAKVWVGGLRDGLHVASTTDFVFAQRSNVEVSCLAIASDGLWACSNEKSGFVVGRSKDEGATFDKMLRFCEIRGPLTCAPGSTAHTQCTLGGTSSNASPPWPVQRALLGCGGGGDPIDAGTDAGTPESQTDGGGGCALRAPSSPAAPLATLVSLGAAIVAFLRRRR